MIKLFLTLLISIFISACSSIKLATDKSYNMTSPYFNSSLSITFLKNSFSGQSTINKFSGEYSLSGEKITVKNFKHTQNNGIFPKTLQEDYIFEVLKNAKLLLINDNEITIISNDNKKHLKYYTPTSLPY